MYIGSSFIFLTICLINYTRIFQLPIFTNIFYYRVIYFQQRIFIRFLEEQQPLFPLIFHNFRTPPSLPPFALPFLYKCQKKFYFHSLYKLSIKCVLLHLFFHSLIPQNKTNDNTYGLDNVTCNFKRVKIFLLNFRRAHSHFKLNNSMIKLALSTFHGE